LFAQCLVLFSHKTNLLFLKQSIIAVIMEFAFFKSALATLFVAVDPPGLAAIFLGLTAHLARGERNKVAMQAVWIASGILLAVMFGGKSVLNSLGISMAAFRVAGGMLLFFIAFEMVFEKREGRKAHSADEAVAHDHPRNIAAFPLAIPLMAGPGAITATIVQAGVAHSPAMNIALAIAIGLVMLACLGVFLLASQIDRLLGNTGRVVLSRILGLLLAALAVQIVGDGVLEFAKF
jgi:multiple antibiotic resistance protein